MDFAQGKFDVTIINDDLQTAKDELMHRADLEEETVSEVLRILASEFEN